MASIVYISSSTTDVITEIASTSQVIISNLQGPQGATGPQGPQGTPGGIASVVAPITNAGTETAAIIGINASSANTASYVVQRDANKEFVAGAVTIDTTLTPTSAPGKLYWDGGGTVNLGLAGGNVSVALGENLVSYVTNAEATTLAVGEVVYVFGASGDRPSVKRASNASEITSSKTLGIVAESIGANQIGFVITRGIIGKLTLGSYTEGAPVYLGSTAGTFTSTKPVAPANLVALGWVIRANNGNGQIYLNVQNGFELEELHNVLITSAANGNFLVYDSADSLWKNQAISATAPITYNASTRTIAANSATTSATGVVQLSDSTSSTSTTTAATPNAVKSAYDLANTANTTANAAVPQTRTISTTAPLTGGGDLTANRTLGVSAASTSASGVVQLTDSTSTTSSVLAATPTAVKAAYDLATTANATANAAIPATQKAAANGVATLDASGLVPTNQLPALAITNTFVVNSQAAMLALTAQTGDVAIRTDLSESYILTADPASTLANWQELLSPPDAVTSVDGRVGAVTLTDKYAQLATANTFTGGVQQITTASASTAGLIIKASASQTENLQVWQNSSASNLVGIGGTGGIFINRTTGSSTTALIMSTGATTSTGIRVDGVAGQTADLQAWRDSGGTVLSNVTASGGFETNGSLRFYTSSARSAWSTLTNTSGNLSFNYQFALTDRLTVTAGAAATVPVTVKGAASQSGDLTQWQNSAGTVRAYVNSSGAIGTAIGYANAANTGTYLDTTTNQMTAIQRVAGTTAFAIRGAVSQTADLLQIQDSNANVLNGFDASGNLRQAPAELVQYGAEGSLLQNIPTRVHPAETLLKQAVWWIDSAHSGSSGQAIKNLGWGGSALDTTAGSSTAADSNDPVYLEWSGENYVYLPGITGNTLSTPSTTALSFTGSFDLRVRVGGIDWTINSSGNNPFISKDNASSDRSWSFYRVSGAKTLRLVWSSDGSTVQTRTSSADVPAFTNWVRTTLDSSNGDVKFFTSSDGITWTQLGTTQTGTGATVFGGNQNIQIGANFTALGGEAIKIYRAQILNGIDGVPVLDVDTSVIATGAATSFTALTGQTVTINRSTSGRKTTSVTHPVWLFGTDDYMEVNNRWLERTTANYLYLPGVSSNNAAAPDSAVLSITGDIDLRAKVAMDDWTPGAAQIFLSKGAAGNFSYSFYLNVDGKFVFMNSTTGSNNLFTSSSVAPTIADGSTLWVRVTLDVDNGASGNTVTFFTSTDGANWTQLGTPVVNAGVTSIYDGTSQLEIGTWQGGANPSRGKIFRAQVLNGIGGTVAFDANFETGITTNLPTTFTESSANAAVVTINYSGTAYRSAGVIASTYVFPGATNTFKLSSYSMLDFGATDSFSLFAVSRRWDAQTALRVLIGKVFSSNGDGYALGYTASATTITNNYDDGVGTANSSVGTITAGALLTSAGVNNRSTNLATAFLNTVNGASLSIAGLGAPASSLSKFTVGGYGDGSAFYTDTEFYAAAVFRRALTASEIATLNSYFQGRVA